MSAPTVGIVFLMSFRENKEQIKFEVTYDFAQMNIYNEFMNLLSHFVNIFLIKVSLFCL
jgi:hypothetical protein